MATPERRTKANLLRHDRMIVVNELRSALSSWTDRLIAFAVLSVALVALHASLSRPPFVVAASLVSVLAAVIAAGTARTIRRRLDFHAYDGAIAADALAGGSRRHYVLSIHATVCGMVTVSALAARPETILAVPLGYLAGAGSWHIARRAVFGRGGPRRPALLRPVGAFLREPIAGVLAAFLVVLPLLLVGSIEPGPMAAFVGLVSVIAAALLTMLDDRTVRFMTVFGYRSGRIIAIHARSLLVFLLLTIPACLVFSRGVTAIVVAGVVSAALVLMTARILVYRVHPKRTADTVVGICTAASCIAASATPMLLPLVVAAILWHLHRRSVPATWMLT